MEFVFITRKAFFLILITSESSHNELQKTRTSKHQMVVFFLVVRTWLRA